VTKYQGAAGAASDHRQKVNELTETAAQLQQVQFPPRRQVVAGILPEGCYLLAGPPKVGKSYFGLEIGLAITSGGPCLGGLIPDPGSALYLILEGGRRRHQERLRNLVGNVVQWPTNFHHADKWPRQKGDGDKTKVECGIEYLDAWCDMHPDARVVIIDILEKFRPPRCRDIYKADYDALAALAAFAERRAILVVVLHHTRKGSSIDPVEEISGTQGIAGGADGYLVFRRTGFNRANLIRGGGRDVAPAEWAMSFSGETFRWTILGDVDEVRAKNDRKRILEFLDENPNHAFSVSNIVTNAELAGSRGSIWKQLSRMAKAGEIKRTGRDRYQSVSGCQDDSQANDNNKEKAGS
jgi:hypothetical protein